MCSGIHLLEESRLRMVLRVVNEGASVTQVAAEFCVSRKTVHKWIACYERDGVRGVSHRGGGRPLGSFRTEDRTCGLILWLKRKEPEFGPKKIHCLLGEQLAPEEMPSLSTVARVLRRAGLTEAKGRGRRLCPSSDAGIVDAAGCNDLWTMDFKGHWYTLDGLKCNPLTVQDAFSRFLLLVKPLESQLTGEVKSELILLFKRYGMPKSVRFDNGPPFACTAGPHGLSRLGAWLTALGIRVERMQPGHPEQNARHERMHGVLAQRVRPRSYRLSEETARLEEWRHHYNVARPHEGIGMQRPGSVYRPSGRMWCGGVQPWCYPDGWQTRSVKQKGFVKLDGKLLFVSESLGGHEIGLEPMETESGGGSVGDRTAGERQQSVTPGRQQSVTPERPLERPTAWRLWFRELELGVVRDGALEASWKK